MRLGLLGLRGRDGETQRALGPGRPMWEWSVAGPSSSGLMVAGLHLTPVVLAPEGSGDAAVSRVLTSRPQALVVQVSRCLWSLCGVRVE